MKKRINDPARPEGFYYGYESAADCLADYEGDLARERNSSIESVLGYTFLWVFLAAVVILSIIAGAASW